MKPKSHETVINFPVGAEGDCVTHSPNWAIESAQLEVVDERHVRTLAVEGSVRGKSVYVHDDHPHSPGVVSPQVHNSLYPGGLQESSNA